MGIQVFPPDVNESFYDFRVTQDGIRFALGAVKNVGQAPASSVVEAREGGNPFTSLFDLCQRVDLRAVNKRVLESLIQAGAMDSLAGNRAQLLAGVAPAIEYAQGIQKDRERGQTSLFEKGEVDDSSVRTHLQLPNLPEWHINELLAREKALLGFYVSGHPLTNFQDEVEAFASISLADLDKAADGQDVSVAGIITAHKRTTDRKGQPMAFVTIEDFSGSVEAILFADFFEKFQTLIYNDSAVLARARVSTREERKAKLRIMEMVPLSEVREKFVTTVRLSLSSVGLESSLVEDLKALLQAHPGRCRVVVEVQTPHFPNVRIQLKNIKVLPSKELIAKLKEMLGEDKVGLRANTPNAFPWASRAIQ